MKHNLATILKELNLYVGIDKASGMIPITPMHMEIDRMRKELEDQMTYRFDLMERCTKDTKEESIIAVIKEVLG